EGGAVRLSPGSAPLTPTFSVARRRSRWQAGRGRSVLAQAITLPPLGGMGRPGVLLAGAKTQGLEHWPGRQRDAWMDDKDAELRQDERGGEYFTDPAHHARPRIEADRNVGAGGARRRVDSLIVEAEMIDLGDEPQRRRGIGRSAAKPGTGRQPLETRETTNPKTTAAG